MSMSTSPRNDLVNAYTLVTQALRQLEAAGAGAEATDILCDARLLLDVWSKRATAQTTRMERTEVNGDLTAVQRMLVGREFRPVRQLLARAKLAIEAAHINAQQPQPA